MSLTLDAGALIAFERGDRAVVAILKRALQAKEILAVPAGVVGQVWRDGRRQVPLARLLASELIELEALDGELARAAGQLCGARGTADVIDASVVLCARARDQGVLTRDPDDLAQLDPGLRLVII